LTQDGSIAAGHEKQILRAGRDMGINNGGDTLELIDPNGNVVDQVTFGSTVEGEILEFGP